MRGATGASTELTSLPQLDARLKGSMGADGDQAVESNQNTHNCTGDSAAASTTRGKRPPENRLHVACPHVQGPRQREARG